MKYRITSKRRAAAFLSALLVYAAISVTSSFVEKWNTGLFVQLALAAVTSITVLVLIFKPFERTENEKAQTVHNTGDCCSGDSNT